MIRVGLNGFGRIGRALFRLNAGNPRFEVVAINDLDPNVDNHVYLLKYDSTYGRFQGEVTGYPAENLAMVDGRPIRFYAEPEISAVPWERHEVDVVVDASGVFENVVASRSLVEARRVRKVIITHAPRSGVDQTVIFGVNERSYLPDRHHVISTSICDVNAAAPTLAALDAAFGIDYGFLTTLHPWLSYQNVLDGSIRSVSSPGNFWSDFALGRASSCNLIPKQTTLVAALGEVLPDLASVLEAISFRVPTAVVSACDMTLMLRQAATQTDVERVFRDEEIRIPGVLRVADESLVSVDFAGTPHSAAVDSRWIRINRGRLLKVVVWYDNEWGYAHRVADAVALTGGQRAMVPPMVMEAVCP